MKKIELSKQQKILLVLSELSNNTKKNLKFEDITISLFKRFPKDFHLKGYENFPDSGDSIKRPLYTFRDEGLLIVRNMVFSLTDKGIELSGKIKNISNKKQILTKENFDRYINKEIIRLEKLNSFQLFVNKKYEKILDTDFFDFIGSSVKTERMDFKSRLKILDEVLNILEKQDEKKFIFISNFIKFMKIKFKDIINYKLKK